MMIIEVVTVMWVVMINLKMVMGRDDVSDKDFSLGLYFSQGP